MQLNKTFYARCSSIGAIMSEPQKKHPRDIYNDHIESLEARRVKAETTKNRETETYKKLVASISDMEHQTDLLKLNSEKLHLSKTCIETVYDWIKEQNEFYGRSVNFRSKYCDKGNRLEAESIKLASEYFGWGNVSKNNERLYNDYLTGEADIVLPESIEDIKNSWSQKTFPLFGTEIPIDGYGWQGQGYMELYDKPKFGLVYTLMDADEKNVEREAWARVRDLGLDELEDDLYQEVKAHMTYSGFPLELRIKRFQLDRDRSVMDPVKYRVDDIRKFIEQL